MRRLIRSIQIPMMILASVAVYLFSLDGELGFGDGLPLFVCLLLFLGYCIMTARSPEAATEETLPEEVTEAASDRKRDIILVLLGMVGLGVGAELMVRGAVTIATLLGIPEVIIGLSIVAVGTSLPELAASMVSAWKGEMDISVGNVIGSNIFNVLFVLGICPMVQTLQIEPRVLSIDYPVMLGFCFLLVALLTLVRPRLEINRKKGIFLLACYALFLIGLF